MHLVGFITKKFVTMQHGHMNVKTLVIVFQNERVYVNFFMSN
jgi:hypothetical protein